MQEAEQRWRSSHFVNYTPSPTESVADGNELETTLVPSADTSFEDTLTEYKETNRTFSSEETTVDAQESKESNDSNINEVDNRNDEVVDGVNEVGDEVNVKDVSGDDEVFEDCENDEEKVERVENYTLEMKLALGISD